MGGNPVNIARQGGGVNNHYLTQERSFKKEYPRQGGRIINVQPRQGGRIKIKKMSNPDRGALFTHYKEGNHRKTDRKDTQEHPSEGRPGS